MILDILQTAAIILLVLWNFHIVAGANKSLALLLREVVALRRKVGR